MVTASQAKLYFGLEDDQTKYLKIRSEIRLLCQQLDVVNQQSDRWDDLLVRVVDQIVFFSKRRTYRKAWNERQSTQEGLDFLAALKALVGDAAANFGDKLRHGMGENDDSQSPPYQWVTDCYHLTDEESSCVSFRIESYIFCPVLNTNWHRMRTKSNDVVE